MAKFKTHYDNLNVSRDAPASVIKAAYKALCQKYHPDKYPGGQDEALRIIKNINTAYAVLSDVHKRAEHDQWIEKQERQLAHGEAQRIMTIISKHHPNPPKSKYSNHLQKLAERWKKPRKLQSRKQIKTDFKPLVFAASAVIIAAISGLVYLTNHTQTENAPSAAKQQEIAAMLKKARQLVATGSGEKALSLYLALAKQGNAEAQFYAGLLYANGDGIAKDNKTAAEWIGKAAEQGYKDAQTKLGFMYATGTGVPQNYSQANYWCYQAAQQGDAIAQYNLGLMYAEGQGVAKDKILAFTWYSKAAAQGHAKAQFNLAELYANGDGTDKDKKQAMTLYRQAASQGIREAEEALKKLENSTEAFIAHPNRKSGKP